MSTSTLISGALAYGVTGILLLAVLVAAKRGDRTLERAPLPEPTADGPSPQAPGAVVTEASDDLAQRLVADLAGASSVQRAVVVLHEPGETTGGVVAASCGLPNVLGRRVPAADGIDGVRALLRRRGEDGGSLRVASLPIQVGGRPVGFVAIASGSARLESVPRLAGRAARDHLGTAPVPRVDAA